MIRINPKVKSKLFLASMVLFVTACGQRGPLYLPETKPEPVEKSETEANKTEDSTEKTPGPVPG